MTEVLHGVRKHRRCPVRRAWSPRQQHARVRNVGHRRLGGRPGERRRLWRPVEYHLGIGRRVHRQSRSTSRLSSLTHCPASVDARVRPTQVYKQTLCVKTQTIQTHTCLPEFHSPRSSLYTEVNDFRQFPCSSH